MMNVTKTWEKHRKNEHVVAAAYIYIYTYMRQTCSSCKTTDAENDAGFYVREA